MLCFADYIPSSRHSRIPVPVRTIRTPLENGQAKVYACISKVTSGLVLLMLAGRLQSCNMGSSNEVMNGHINTEIISNTF